MVGSPVVSERDLHHIDQEYHCVKHEIAKGRTQKELIEGCLSLNDVYEGKQLVARHWQQHLDWHGHAYLLDNEYSHYQGNHRVLESTPHGQYKPS